MSSISVRIDGDVKELMEKLQSLSNVDKAGVMNAIAEGLRTSTVERFLATEEPSGKKWRPSIRVIESGGKTLTKSATLRNSIKAQADSKGAAVGTNLVYAATHQLGDEREIKAKKGRYLRFSIRGRWVSVPSVKVKIPARPFLGISDEDMKEIKGILEEAVKE